MFKKNNKRKLDGSYISFDFICIAKCSGTQKPDCFLCDKFPANEHVKSRQLICKHPENKSHNVDFPPPPKKMLKFFKGV